MRNVLEFVCIFNIIYTFMRSILMLDIGNVSLSNTETITTRTLKKQSLEEFLSKIKSEDQTKTKLYFELDGPSGLEKFLMFDNASLFKEKTLVAKLNENSSFREFTILHKKVTMKRELPECLYAHNVIRSAIGSGNLIWDADLAYNAEQWAITLAARDKGMVHSHMPDNNGIYFGENIYLWEENGQATCENATYYWYSEPTRTEITWVDTRHYAQVIWPDTTRIGVGLAINEDMDTYIVAQYMRGLPTTGDLIPYVELEEKDLTVDGRPLGARVATFTIPEEGGWTSWEIISPCSVTCGIGIRFERRFCIDRNAPTNPNPNICGEGGRQRMVSCKKMDCPPKDYICNDTISNCGAIKQNCLESEDWESMKKNCKKTCGFCQPCKDSNPDCPSYSTAPYNFCTDVRYRDWMVAKCSKSCGYCDQKLTTIYDTECINYHPDCEPYAKKFNYCFNDTYRLWMSVYCKESCGFCQSCNGKFPLCTIFDDTYCSGSDLQPILMREFCPKKCNFCFETPSVT